MLTFHFLTQQLYLTQPRASGDLTHTHTDTQCWLCVGLEVILNMKGALEHKQNILRACTSFTQITWVFQTAKTSIVIERRYASGYNN